MTFYINKKRNIKLTLPIDRDSAELFMRRTIIVLSALALVVGVICIVLALQIKWISIEAGESISASKIAKYDGATFADDFDPDCVNHPGIYYFTVQARDKQIDVRLKVSDTKAPVVTVKDVYFAVGSTVPKPVEFIDTIYEPDGYTAEFLTPIPEIKSLGVFPMQVRFIDASGNKTKPFDVNMTLIYDSQPPEIEVKTDIVAYVGEAVSYKQNVQVTDNCTGDIKLTVDDSRVDLATAGEYPAYISATDAVGNKSAVVEITVHVYAQEITDAQLNEKLEQLVSRIIRDGMTKEEQCRAIYDYVQSNISYVSTSDKTVWQRAAYDALFVSGSGDCYSYFAAAKSFLQYLGIDNLDIQRTKGYTTDTHFWSLVNIGTEEEPRWYHFDCTRLRADFNHSGCLLTLKQTEAYNKVRDSFYRYDKDDYPTVATEIITPTPELEDYYD